MLGGFEGIEQLGRGFNKGGIHTEKSPTLTSSRWENNHRLIQIGVTGNTGIDSKKRVYSIEGKCPTLTSAGGNTEKKIGVVWTADRDKAHCIDANYHKGGTPEQYFNKSRRQLLFSETVVAGAMRGRYLVDGVRKDGKGTPIQYIESRKDGKTNTLTTVQKDNVVLAEPVSGRTLPSQVLWRKLYPVECERLQTVPDNYTDCVSNTQRYKMLGNGWTIDVIAHIFKGLI